MWATGDILRVLTTFHDEDNIEWLHLLALLERADEPPPQLSKDFGIHIVRARWLRDIACETRIVPKRAVLDFVMSKVVFRTPPDTQKSL